MLIASLSIAPLPCSLPCALHAPTSVSTWMAAVRSNSIYFSLLFDRRMQPLHASAHEICGRSLFAKAWQVRHHSNWQFAAGTGGPSWKGVIGHPQS